MDTTTAQDLLKTSASQYSSDVQRNQEISKVITDSSDSVLDLSEQQIIVMSMYRAVHERVLPLPQTMAFLSNYGSLSRSRDRMGRQEFVECHARRPTYIVNPHDTDVQEMQQAKQQASPQKSRWNLNPFRRNKGPA
jgi:hypothetical protein